MRVSLLNQDIFQTSINITIWELVTHLCDADYFIWYRWTEFRKLGEIGEQGCKQFEHYNYSSYVYPADQLHCVLCVVLKPLMTFAILFLGRQSEQPQLNFLSVSFQLFIQSETNAWQQQSLSIPVWFLLFFFLSSPLCDDAACRILNWDFHLFTLSFIAWCRRR